MEQLTPHHVPVYQTPTEQRKLWEQCAERNQPVVAVRDARRGYIVRYDLQHLGCELTGSALATLRQRARDWQPYPTASADDAATDPLSEAEALGGEAGPVSGSIHTPTEEDARALASRLSALVFDRSRRE
jgi:hypothetical protein